MRLPFYTKKEVENIVGAYGDSIFNKAMNVVNEIKNRTDQSILAVSAKVDDYNNNIKNTATYCSLQFSELRNEDVKLSNKVAEVYKFLNNQVDIFNTDLNNKIAFLYKSVDEKIAMGGNNGGGFTGLLRKIAVLEGVKDVVEHRRKPEELLSKVDELKMRLSDYSFDDKGYEIVLGQINLLEWVLGKSFDVVIEGGDNG